MCRSQEVKAGTRCAETDCKSVPLLLPPTAEGFDQEDGGEEEVAVDAGEILFGAEKGALGVEHFVIGYEAGFVAF